MTDIKRGPMTDEERNRIFAIAEKMRKPNPHAIARKLNRSPSTVGWFMLMNGLMERRKRLAGKAYQRNGVWVHPYTDEHDKRISALRVDGKTGQEIADIITKEFGIARTAHSVNVRLVFLASYIEEAAA